MYYAFISVTQFFEITYTKLKAFFLNKIHIQFKGEQYGKVKAFPYS